MKNKADQVLMDWLEEHYDDLMRCKEFLHHEGTGKRTEKEWREARKIYSEEQLKLIAQLQAKQAKAISRWIDQGFTREKAFRRWEKMRTEAYERMRFNYAMQKD